MGATGRRFGSQTVFPDAATTLQVGSGVATVWERPGELGGSWGGGAFRGKLGGFEGGRACFWLLTRLKQDVKGQDPLPHFVTAFA